MKVHCIKIINPTRLPLVSVKTDGSFTCFSVTVCFYICVKNLEVTEHLGAELFKVLLMECRKLPISHSLTDFIWSISTTIQSGLSGPDFLISFVSWNETLWFRVLYLVRVQGRRGQWWAGRRVSHAAGRQKTHRSAWMNDNVQKFVKYSALTSESDCRQTVSVWFWPHELFILMIQRGTWSF